MTSLPPPTSEVSRLADLVGPEAAFRLVEEYGGTRVYVPAGGADWLTNLMGRDAAEKLVAAMGGEYLKVPLGRTWRVLAYHARHWTRPRIARRVGCSEDAIQRILQPRRLTQPQLDLFKRPN